MDKAHVLRLYKECFGPFTIVLLQQKYTARAEPKVMSNFFLHANCEQQTKESAVVDGTSCCVILECLVTSIACII